MTFVGNLPPLGRDGFPTPDPTLPMMSMKMLLACLSVGAFPSNFIPPGSILLSLNSGTFRASGHDRCFCVQREVLQRSPHHVDRYMI